MVQHFYKIRLYISASTYTLKLYRQYWLVLSNNQTKYYQLLQLFVHLEIWKDMQNSTKEVCPITIVHTSSKLVFNQCAFVVVVAVVVIDVGI